MKNVKIMLIKDLRPHEETDIEALGKLKAKWQAGGYIIDPVVVEKDNLVILDGHHRVRALKDLGYRKIPVFLVDYSDSDIKVVSRREGIDISKEIVIQKALSGQVFPHKTTKHFIPNRPRGVNMDLDKLR